jgi:hypothetical protein
MCKIRKHCSVYNKGQHKHRKISNVRTQGLSPRSHCLCDRRCNPSLVIAVIVYICVLSKTDILQMFRLERLFSTVTSVHMFCS